MHSSASAKCREILPLGQSFGPWQYRRDQDEFVVVLTDDSVVVVVEIVVVDVDTYVVVVLVVDATAGARVVVSVKLLPPQRTLQTDTSVTL